MFLFQLNAGGRTQDCYNVDAKKFLKAIKAKEPYLLESKKTDCYHWVLLDERIRPYIESFVEK